MTTRLWIAGSRSGDLTAEDLKFLDNLPFPELVIEGGAAGIDRAARIWARLRGIHVATIEANWGAHGKAAGPLRNRACASLATCLVAFKGGAGTASAVAEAKKAGIPVIDRRN